MKICATCAGSGRQARKIIQVSTTPSVVACSPNLPHEARPSSRSGRRIHARLVTRGPWLQRAATAPSGGFSIDRRSTPMRPLDGLDQFTDVVVLEPRMKTQRPCLHDERSLHDAEVFVHQLRDRPTRSMTLAQQSSRQILFERQGDSHPTMVTRVPREVRRQPPHPAGGGGSSARPGSRLGTVSR